MHEPSETWHFGTARVGRRVLVFDELPSTNTAAAELANPGREPGVPDDIDGTVIVARNQTAGRGRYGRIWQSRPGGSLLMSVVLFPPPELRRPSVLTAWAALAVGDAIYSLTGVQAKIKWPNDLLIRGKKVCGILIEQGHACVTGVGLNLTQAADEFAAAGLPDATSLLASSGRSVDLRAAAEVVCTRLDAEYTRLLAGERTAVEADWKWRTGLLGRAVAVELTDGVTVTGRMHEMGFDAIEVETADGVVRAIRPEAVAQIKTI